MADKFLNKLLLGVSYRLNKVVYDTVKQNKLNWFHVKILKHLPVGKERSVKLEKNTLFYVSPPELLHGLKEIFEEKVYAQKLSSNPYIIDCGANIGMSVIYLKKIATDAVIDAFEPDSLNFALLKKNIASFKLAGITPHQAAVWKENTTLSFFSDGSMSSRINDDKNEIVGAAYVKAVRLKDYLIKTVDFLKIDIEGAEYAVIVDIADSLHYVKAMFVEYHGAFSQNSQLIEIFGIINKSGFSFYIKEATSVYDSPFLGQRSYGGDWDVQLNIFCFRN